MPLVENGLVNKWDWINNVSTKGNECRSLMDLRPVVAQVGLETDVNELPNDQCRFTA